MSRRRRQGTRCYGRHWAKGDALLEGHLNLSRSLAPLFPIIAAIILAGCTQSVFVGMPERAPEQLVLAPDGDAPMPPFGPSVTPRLYEAPGDAPIVLVDTTPDIPAGPAFAWSETENILVLGTDRRPWDASWRTDTIIVVGLDRAGKRAAVLSIPRDLYIEIPNYGYGRINQVDYIGERITRVKGGGPALVSDVLSDTFGIATEHWVRFEMTGFESVVDAVGGVTVNLDCPFAEPIFNLDTNSWEYFTLPAGDVYMDGETANWFVRLRLSESDIGRAKRQRQFLWALRDQVLQTNLLRRFPELWTAFRHTFTTDLSLLQMVDLIQFGTGLDSSNVRASGITLKELQSHITESGASVLIITDPATVQRVVDGIWDAPAMADSYQKDSTQCAPLPTGVPMVALDGAQGPPPAAVTPESPVVESEPVSSTVTADGPPMEGG